MAGANLQGADLRGMDFSGANLKGANLSGANAQGVNLSGANLENTTLIKTNFSEAILDHAKLNSAALIATNFFAAKLRAAELNNTQIFGLFENQKNFGNTYHQLINIFEVLQSKSNEQISLEKFFSTQISIEKIPQININQIDLNALLCNFKKLTSEEYRTCFRKAKMQGAKFNNAIIMFTDFSESKMGTSDFSESTILFANFIHANLNNVKFDKAKTLMEINFSNSEMIDVKFNSIKAFSDIKFNNSNLSLAKFNESTLYNVDFTGVKTSLKNAEFTKSKIISGNFSEILLLNTILNFAAIENSKFIKASFLNAQLNNTVISQSDFSGIVLAGTQTHHITVKETTLIKSTFKDLIFGDSLFAESDFSGSHFDNVSFIKSWLGRINMSNITSSEKAKLLFHWNYLTQIDFNHSTLFNFEFYAASLENLPRLLGEEKNQKKIYQLNSTLGEDLNFSYACMKNGRFVGSILSKQDFFYKYHMETKFKEMLIRGQMINVNFDFADLHSIVFTGFYFTKDCKLNNIANAEKCIFDNANLETFQSDCFNLSEDLGCLKSKGAMVNRMVAPAFELFWLGQINNAINKKDADGLSDYIELFLRSLVGAVGSGAVNFVFESGLLVVKHRIETGKWNCIIQ